MAPIAAKLWQNAFQTICNFSFLNPENLFRGSFFGKKNCGSFFCFWKGEVLEELWISKHYRHVRREKLLPELPLFLGRLPWRRGKWPNMCRKSRLGAKNDFNHSKILGSIFVFEKVRFWRSYEFLSVVSTSVVKSYCPNCPYFWGDFLGEGVNDSICAENLDLEPKMTSTIQNFLGLEQQMVEVILGPRTASKTQTDLFTPSPRKSPQK